MILPATLFGAFGMPYALASAIFGGNWAFFGNRVANSGHWLFNGVVTPSGLPLAVSGVCLLTGLGGGNFASSNAPMPSHIGSRVLIRNCHWGRTIGVPAIQLVGLLAIAPRPYLVCALYVDFWLAIAVSVSLFMVCPNSTGQDE